MEKKCVSRESDNFKILRSWINRNLFVYVFITALRNLDGWGGFVQMYWTQRSEGPCLGEGGTTMMQIITGLTGHIVGGFVRMYWTQQSEGPCLGGRGGTTMMQIIAGLTGQVVGKGFI